MENRRVLMGKIAAVGCYSQLPRALRMTEQWVHQPAQSVMHSWRAPSAWNGPQMEREVQNGLAAAAPRIALLPMYMYCNFIF